MQGHPLNGSWKPDYSVGDEIRCIHEGSGTYIMVGMIYTVRDITFKDNEWLVKLDGPIVDRYLFWASRFERITASNPSNTNAPAVNDHVCPTCGNNRCSKSERTCWSCGGAL